MFFMVSANEDSFEFQAVSRTNIYGLKRNVSVNVTCSYCIK